MCGTGLGHGGRTGGKELKDLGRLEYMVDGILDLGANEVIWERGK